MSTPVGRLGRTRSFFTFTNLLVALTVVIVALVIVPLGLMAINSFWSESLLATPGHLTLINYQKFLTNPRTPSLLWQTLVMIVGSSLLAIIIGTALAWIVARTEVPGRSFLLWMPAAPLLLSGLLRDTAWVQLYSPETGIVNRFLIDTFGLESAPLDCFTMLGVILSGAFSLYPLAYVTLLGPLSSMNRSLEEASRASGAKWHYTLRRVTIPLAWPALLSTLILTAIITARSFETPVILGLPGGISVFTSSIYRSMITSGDYALSAAQSMVYLVGICVLLVWYRRSTRAVDRFVLTDSRGQSGRIPLGRWKWVIAAIGPVIFLITFVQPLAATVYTSLIPFYSVTSGAQSYSLDNYRTALTFPGTISAIRDSLLLAVLTAVICVAAALVLSLLAFKTKLRGRRIGEFIGTLPFALPPVVFSVAVLVTFVSLPILSSLYQTLALVIVTLLVVFLPIALRIVSPAVIAVDSRLLEAAASCGARPFRTLRTISLPLLVPPLAGATGLLLMLSFTELSAIALTVPPGITLLPLQIFNMWDAGMRGPVTALNVVTLLILLLLVVIARVFVWVLKKWTNHRRTRSAAVVGAVVADERVLLTVTSK